MYKSPFDLAGILLACAAMTVFAQGRVDRSLEPSPRDCSDVKWSAAVLKVYPGIAAACQGVQKRDGKTYVMFESTVDQVVDGGEQVRVDFNGGGGIKLAPPPNTTLYIKGEESSLADLRRGADLNFYVPEDRLQAEFRADSNPTASVLPWFAVAGTALLLLLGASFTFGRILMPALRGALKAALKSQAAFRRGKKEHSKFHCPLVCF